MIQNGELEKGLCLLDEALILINQSPTGELKKIKEIFSIFTKYDQKDRIVNSNFLIGKKRPHLDSSDDQENDLINDIMNFSGFKKEKNGWNKRTLK